MTGPIVVGVDGSPQSTAAVDWAADDAARRGVPLKIVHVREPWANKYPFHRVEGFDQSLSDYCEGVISGAAKRARERVPGLAVTAELATGMVVEKLKAESRQAAALVVGSRGMGGFAGLVLGSVGLGVAGHATCPVVVVRGPGKAGQREIVVGFDGSEHSEAAMRYAFEEAELRGVGVRVVYAWQIPAFTPFAIGYTRALDEVLEQSTDIARRQLAPWREKYPDVPVTQSAVCGHPIAVLSDFSRGADLLVVGSRGLGGFGSAVLGSVGHGVLHRAHCAVAVVRPGEPS
ncbi:universal stress protein [Microtetraspora sp. NBRC 16547]|uniref:universal stress protein n=1 Tax=Microtetraspora sp. NBRC 16547 TaxID=3030993 RepID=UPI0024A2EC10|nr:universal stress protein [Microtetraspora sp. NBRC 16547]GLX01920.1 universal stress protein [Microtetraspora sp. NBRC 16547]